MEKEMQPLKCENCKKDILSSEEGGMLVIVQHNETGEIDDVYASCDSECYDELREVRVGEAEIDLWRDIAELKNPVLFLDFVVEQLDRFQGGMHMNDKEYEKLKAAIFKCAQYALRDMTDLEKKMAVQYKLSKI